MCRTYLIIFFYMTEVVQLLMSMQVDRINQAQLQWNSNYLNPNSREYRVLYDEATKAVRHLWKCPNSYQGFYSGLGLFKLHFDWWPGKG